MSDKVDWHYLLDAVFKDKEVNEFGDLVHTKKALEHINRISYLITCLNREKEERSYKTTHIEFDNIKDILEEIPD